MTEEEKQTRGFKRRNKEKRPSKRSALKMGVIIATSVLGAGGLAALARLFQERSVSSPPQVTEELGPEYSLASGEFVDLGRVRFINESRKIDFKVFPANLSEDLAREANLMVAGAEPITIVLSDITDADPSTGEVEVAMTGYDPKTKGRISQIALDAILQSADSQRDILNTQERYNFFVSLFVSQASYVEIYNSGHAEEIDLDKPETLEDVDRRANEMGVVYRNRMYKGEAKPFIVVSNIKK